MVVREGTMSDSYGNQLKFKWDETCYDLFEKLPDGGSQWLGVFVGLENATNKLIETAARNQHEVYLMDLRAHKMVARQNAAA
jgi:hypothetical protein